MAGFNDIHEPVGSACNQGGIRSFEYHGLNGSGPHRMEELLSDLVLDGRIPLLLEDRSKAELIALVEDVASYVATLKRENRFVVVGRDSRKVLTTGSSIVDTRMKQDYKVLTTGVEATRQKGSGDTADIERRLRAVEEKLGI